MIDRMNTRETIEISDSPHRPRRLRRTIGLRRMVRETRVDAGDLVPDDLIVAMAAARLQEPDAQDGFILDGFPRTIEQAEALDKQLAALGRRVTAALLIDVPDEEVIRRLSGRRVCVKSGHNYHLEFDPPKREGVCDQDGSRLIQRDDDQPGESQRHAHR